MVDVVGLDDDLAARTLNGRHVCVQTQDVLDRREDVVEGQDALIQRKVEAELPVDLVPTHLREVVPLGVEVEVVDQIACVLQRGWLTRPQLAVDVQQRIVLALDGVLLQRCHEDLVLTESFANLFGGHAEGLEQHRHRLLALAVDTNGDEILLVDLELEPCAAARNDLGGEDVLIRRLVDGALEVRPGGTHELRHNDALGSVDDKRSLIRHQGEVAHEYRLGFDLTGLVVHELGGYEERGGVGEVLFLALLDGVLRRLKTVIAEGQGHHSGKILDWADLFEDLGEAGHLGDLGVPCGDL